MADNKISIVRRQIRGSNEYGSGSVDESGNLVRLKSHVSELRDQFRAAFSDPRYVVSDIAQWTGASGVTGLAFIFRDTTKVCEWLFSFGAMVSSYSYIYPYNYAGNSNSTTIGGYYQTVGTTSLSNPSTTANSIGLVHFNYNYTVSTYAMNFTNTTTLTYGSGDYQAPSSNPYSALSSFMPSATGRTKSYDLSSWCSGSFYNKIVYVYYPEKGTLSFDVTYGSNLGYYGTFVSGKEIYPTNANGGLANPSDTRRDGCFVIQRIPSSANWSSVESAAYMFNGFVRDDGTTVETLGRPANILNDFNRSNYLSSGLVKKRKIQISVGAYIKGYIDVEIANESFPYNDFAFCNMRLALPDSDNPMIKDHPQITRFWKKDFAPFVAIVETGLPTS